MTNKNDINMFVTLNKYYNHNNIHDKKLNSVQMVENHLLKQLVFAFQKKLQICLVSLK